LTSDDDGVDISSEPGEESDAERSAIVSFSEYTSSDTKDETNEEQSIAGYLAMYRYLARSYK